MLDLDHLKSFVAILETGSFTRASERVNKTQPSVSAHVRHLERLLGCALFEKSGRGVRVSEDGERFAEYARRMIALETAALSAVRKGSVRGRVRFGIPDDYAEPLLPRILQQVIRSHPALEIMVVCESSFGLAERIAAGEIDLALVTDSGTFNDIELVRAEPLLWVASPRFALDLEDAIPLALGGASCQWRQAAEKALAEAGLKFRLVLISAHFSAIGPMVASGAAITVLPPSAMRSGMYNLTDTSHLPRLPSTSFGILKALGNHGQATLILSKAVREALEVP